MWTDPHCTCRKKEPGSPLVCPHAQANRLLFAEGSLILLICMLYLPRNKTVITIRRSVVAYYLIAPPPLLSILMHIVRSFIQTQVNAVILPRIGRRPLPSISLPNLYSLFILPRNALCGTIPRFVIETITNMRMYFQCQTSKTSPCLQELMKCQ
jgi:hypothetical protein